MRRHRAEPGHRGCLPCPASPSSHPHQASPGPISMVTEGCAWTTPKPSQCVPPSPEPSQVCPPTLLGTSLQSHWEVSLLHAKSKEMRVGSTQWAHSLGGSG